MHIKTIYTKVVKMLNIITLAKEKYAQIYVNF